VREQAEIAIEEADLVLFMVDARVGPADIDLDIAKLLRRTRKPTLLVVNKSDNETLELRRAASTLSDSAILFRSPPIQAPTSATCLTSLSPTCR